MSDKKEPEEIHGLILFNDDDRENFSTEEMPVEAVDQHDKIILATELSTVGCNYYYSVLLENISLAPITQIKITIKLPRFFEIKRWVPQGISIDRLELEEKNYYGIIFEFDQLSKKSSTQLDIFLSPLVLNISGEISCTISFLNNKDTVRLLNSDSQMLRIKSVDISPKSISYNELKQFLNNPENGKSMKSYGIGSEIKQDTDLYFEEIEQLLKYQRFSLVEKDEKRKRVWFFGYETGSQTDILIIGQVDSNKIEFLFNSQNQEIVISLLTVIFDHLKKRLLNLGLIEDQNQIYDLECANCGVALPSLPKKGKPMKCRSCKHKRIIW